MDRVSVRGIAVLAGISLVVSFIVYMLDIWLLTSNQYFSPVDATFLEGLFFMIAGIMLLLGSGGINRTSLSAAVLASAAKAVDKDVVGPTEVFRRDAWKSRGFLRLGLILTMAGVFLLVLYFTLL